MPLGKLSRTQIAKGLAVLGTLRDEIDRRDMDDTKQDDTTSLEALTNQFYTTIPHDLGWNRPEIIQTRADVMNKMDNLLVLSDIEIAMSMVQDMDKTKVLKRIF